MGQAKLHVNLQQGIIEAEGDETFVLKVYEDFKQSIVTKASIQHAKLGGEDDDLNPSSGGNARKSAKKPAAKRAANGGGESVGITSYKPSLDKSLDTSKLNAFMSQYEPKNNAERILLYAFFLEHELEITPCNVDQIYTCFHHSKVKLPVAFGQQFVNARGDDYGYIDFTGPTDITIATRGLNHVNHDIKKASTN